MSSHIGCPDIGSPFDLGWKLKGSALTPILHEAFTTSEVIYEIICICKGKGNALHGGLCLFPE